jgi:hypothetical protein
MGFDLPDLDDGLIYRTDSEEMRVKGIREWYWGSKENRNGFSETTRFEVSDDCFG